MPAFIDLTGRRFEMLVVLQFDKRVHDHAYWICRCDCGNVKSVAIESVRWGGVKSCGCLRIKNRWKHGHNSIKKRSSEYTSWDGMIQR